MIRPVPSVAMKPCTLRRLTISAVGQPDHGGDGEGDEHARATTLPVWPAMIPPASTLVRLATKGTDRSRLPTRMTSVCPIAMKPRMLVRGQDRRRCCRC